MCRGFLAEVPDRSLWRDELEVEYIMKYDLVKP